MSKPIAVTFRPGVPARAMERLEPLLAGHHGVDDILAWCRAQQPPRDLTEVVVMDEFSHDLVLEVESGLYAVYAAT